MTCVLLLLELVSNLSVSSSYPISTQRQCPQRCPNGDECPDGSTCFEESPCTTTGVSAPGFVKMDSTKMFCGETYLDATSCGIPCPTGGGCAVGSCWAEVECNAWASTPVTQEVQEEEEDINMMLEVTVNIDEAEDDEQPESMTAPQEQDELSDVSVNADDAQVNEPQEELSNVSVDADSAEVNEPQEPQAMSEPVPVESNPPPPVESSPPPPPPVEESPPPPSPVESNPPPVEAESNPPPAAESSNPPPAAESSNPPPAPVPAQAPGVAVDNLRMALYGLNSFSAAQLVAWEDATASYFQQETGVTNDYDVTSMNLA